MADGLWVRIRWLLVEKEVCVKFSRKHRKARGWVPQLWLTPLSCWQPGVLYQCKRNFIKYNLLCDQVCLWDFNWAFFQFAVLFLQICPSFSLILLKQPSSVLLSRVLNSLQWTGGSYPQRLQQASPLMILQGGWEKKTKVNTWQQRH